ncbi:Glu/Leu/Phe/Val dehydrogenase dimerization domain-containing protein (plasmid) [Streptomyces sp. HUAS 31]|uniref:Glu/Leu/Phe/Val dehydrogenase dimerization domain-containing protein n=1 Tax=Streptomyces sp. HUAS 31 TaxID=3020055 RepID=UPI002306BE54|nr:Glu/Leu/Phe/Val dehydrogenase dimerization domain-containing protein [Streptomyces sp. HUAS 31]WCE02407.1 Glu/Leu/Phe/Val dehydrogenase dimerization domain-containing protein [Streptomyces sp. HUAS 31]
MTATFTTPGATANRAPYLEIVWTDPVTGRQGFVVIDRLVRGVASGGLRMRDGCTLEEVRGLAAGMTRKEALHYDPARRYIPLGGAKGGIDFSPRDPESPAVLGRFLQGIKPVLRDYWTTGEDLGVRQDGIDEAAAKQGLDSTIEAIYPLLDDPVTARRRLADAFAVTVDGVPLPELVGGLGVAESALAALDRAGLEHGSARAVVQGFGSMGGATARYLARAGVKVVGIADAHGVVRCDQGLDVERLLLTRDAFGGVDRTQLRPQDTEADGDTWLDIECDVLVPAAVSYCVTPADQHRITARVIAEAANMPVLPEAEAALHARGVRVLPDFVVNSATNAWWWWTLFGDIAADSDEAHTMVRSAMRRLTENMLDGAAAEGITPRQAAQAVVERNLTAIEAAFT